MIRSTCELPKYAQIYLSGKQLDIYYHSKQKITPIKLENHSITTYKQPFKENDITVSGNLENGRKLILQISLTKTNKNLLYKLAVIFAYIIGTYIDIFIFYTNPYHPPTIMYDHHPLDLYSKSHYHRNLLQYLVHDPVKTLSLLLELLENKDTFFNKLGVSIMEVNAQRFLDLVVVIEYELLQNIGTKTLSEEDKKQCKGSKDHIYKFLHKYKSGEFSSYKDFVDKWNEMRQVIHSFSTKRQNQIFNNKQETYFLHNLLIQLINEEIRDKVSNFSL